VWQVNGSSNRWTEVNRDLFSRLGRFTSLRTLGLTLLGDPSDWSMEGFRALAPRLKRLELDFQEERAQHIFRRHQPLGTLFETECRLHAIVEATLDRTRCPRGSWSLLLSAFCAHLQRGAAAASLQPTPKPQRGDFFFSTKVWMQSCITLSYAIVI
jgi:hypothetical protein